MRSSTVCWFCVCCWCKFHLIHTTHRWSLSIIFYVFVLLINIDVSFLCVCPVIDHEFRHNIAKVAVDPWGDSYTVSVFADYFDNVMTKFIVNNRKDALKTDINMFFTIITNCRIAHSRSLTRRMNFKFVSVRIVTIKISQWVRLNSCSYRKTFFYGVPHTCNGHFTTMVSVLCPQGGCFGEV